MPIGAAIGGVVAGVGGAVISSGAQKHAANQANETQQAATQSQLELGRESLGLNRDIYNSNYGLLSPFVSNGLSASNSLNALLGLPSGPTLTSPLAAQAPQAAAQQAAPNALASGAQPEGIMARTMAGPNGLHPAPTMLPQDVGYTAAQPGQAAYNNHGVGGVNPGHATPARDSIDVNRAARGLPPVHRPNNPAPVTTASPANSAFENFANSAGMQFQLEQGANALNNLYAGRGMLQSGAAMKGINNYAQQTALNNYFMPYLSMLQGQQNMGAQAGAAVAGVGTNFGNTAANINANMGNVIQGGADSAANAAIARGNANANMWSGIGSSLGSVAGSVFGAPSTNALYGTPNPVGGTWIVS